MSSETKIDMPASEMTMRKFLKQLGVTGHQNLADALQKAVQSGRLAPGSDVSVTATIEIGDLQFSHVITGTLQAPESHG